MDLISLAAAKNYTNKVAAGITAARVEGNSIILTLVDGTEAKCSLPVPKDGISVIDLTIDNDGSLLCHMSDGSTIDAGYVPMADVKLEDYYTKEEVNQIIESNNSEVDLTNYYTKGEVDLKVPYEISDTSATVTIKDKTFSLSSSIVQQLADYVASWTNVEIDINRPVKICFGRYNQGSQQLIESTFYGHGTGSSSSSGSMRAKKYLLYAIEPESWYNGGNTSGRTCIAYVDLWISGNAETGYTLQTGSSYLKAGYAFSNYALAENVLPKNNTSSYTPTGDYHPATKKYVDDAIAEAIDSALKANY